VASSNHYEFECGWLKNVSKLIPKLSVAILEFPFSLGCDIDSLDVGLRKCVVWCYVSECKVGSSSS